MGGTTTNPLNQNNFGNLYDLGCAALRLRQLER